MLERNRLYMLQAVVKVVETHKDQWQDMPEFTEGFASLNAYEVKMRDLVQRKELLKQPFGGIKAELRSEFALIMGKLGAYLRLVARKNKDRSLAMVTDFTVAGLERMNGQKTLALAENIVAYTDQYETELEAFDNATDLVEKAKEQIIIFKERGLIPSERRRLLGETTDQIKKLGHDVMDFLKKELDFLMRYFVDMAPVFFNAFKNARVIPKLSGNNRGRGGSDGDSGSAEGDNGIPPEDNGAAPLAGNGNDASSDPGDDGNPPANGPNNTNGVV
jgi:stress response protein YsnF